MKKNRKSVLSGLDLRMLITDIQNYGFTYSARKFALQCLMVLAGVAVIAYVSRLNIYAFMVLGAIALLSMPFIVRAEFRQLYEIKRFQMVESYLDNMIPVFKKVPIVTHAWQECIDLFEGRMHDVVLDALFYIQSNTDDTEPLLKAFEMIEDEFPNSRIHATHQFMYTVETQNSKDYYEAADSVYYDGHDWLSRIMVFQKDITERRNKTVLLCAMTMMSNWLFVAIYSSNSIFKDFTDMPLYQISTSIFMVLLMTMICLFYIKLHGEWIINDRNERIIRKYSKAFAAYAQGKNVMPGKAECILAILFILLASFVYSRTGNIAAAGLTGMLAVYALFIKKINYESAKRTVRRALDIEFPLWLRDVALNLQNYTVLNAVEASRINASDIMTYYIDEFLEKAYADPSDIKPYNEFLGEFNLPEAKASMKMLYSLQNVPKNQMIRQTNSIVSRNQSALAEAEKLKNEDSINGIYKYGFIPVMIFMMQMTVSMVLMVVFLMNYMSSALNF